MIFLATSGVKSAIQVFVAVVWKTMMVKTVMCLSHIQPSTSFVVGIVTRITHTTSDLRFSVFKLDSDTSTGV